MEYVFSTEGNAEILRTKSSDRIELKGFRELVSEYPDQTVTDKYHIARKIKDSVDPEGNYYAWYEIDQHYRYTDKFASNIQPTELEITDHDLAILEAEQFLTDLDLRVMALENNE